MKIKLSLKKLIVGMVAVVSVIIIIFQTIGIGVMFQMLEEQKQETINGMLVSASQTIEDSIDVAERFQRYLLYNQYMQQYLVDCNSGKNSTLALPLSEQLASADRFFSDQISVLLVDKKDGFHTFLNTMSKSEYEKLKEFYQDCKNGISMPSNYFFTVSDGLNYSLCICTISPVKFEGNKSVAMVDAGTLIVMNRVNIFMLINDMEYTNKAGLLLTDTIYGRTADFMEQVKEQSNILTAERKIADTSWVLSGAIVFENQTSALYRMILVVICELVAIIIILVTVQITVMNRVVNKPVSNIINFMDNFILHNTRDRLSTDSPLDEFEILSKHINTMLDKSEEFFLKVVYTQQELYESELAHKEAVLYALQSQINPHFLYNTLECMSSIALSHNATEITEMIESLSAIFRYSMNGQRETTVDEEINMLENYLSIIRFRFPNSFETEFDFEDEVWEQKIIRVLFQPIAENAVLHAFSDGKKNGILKVSGYLENDKLIIEFYDNGKGMSEEQLLHLKEQMEASNKNLYSDQSVGLINIHRRIRLYYGEPYGLQITSEGGEFTKIRIELPIRE